jgi:hypothetical protein
MLSFSRIETMILNKQLEKENDFILLLKVKRKNKVRSKKHTSHYSSISAEMKKTQLISFLHTTEE